MKYHVKGVCYDDCKNRDSHKSLVGHDKDKTDKFIKSLRGNGLSWQGSSDVLPFPRLPPDKPFPLLYKKVSVAVDSLLSSQKQQVNIPLEDRISNSLFPSNLDSSVSADNLKNELLGKSCHKEFMNDHFVKEFHREYIKTERSDSESLNFEVDNSGLSRIDPIAVSSTRLDCNGRVLLPPSPAQFEFKSHFYSI